MMISIQKARIRINLLLEKSNSNNWLDVAVDWFLVILIISNTAAVMLATVSHISERYALPLKWFEVFSVVIFTIEYILRVWSCTANTRFHDSIKGRIRFILLPASLIDLLSILPFYLPMLLPFDLRFIRILRLLRLVRLLKLSRYSDAISTIGRVFYQKRAELAMTLFSGSILLVMASSVVYYAENFAQPDKFSSIPETLWWGVVTLTTVGYGDISPVTPLGKFLGAIICVLGIGLFALPAGILGSGFIEEVQKTRKITVCPHCKREIPRA